jgi:hypothetical protein
MKDHLTFQEIVVLQILERHRDEKTIQVDKTVADRMLRHGLVSIDVRVGFQITARGKHLLFRQRCIALLRNLRAGQALAKPDVARWVVKQGFAYAVSSENEDLLALTSRGDLWLQDVEVEERDAYLSSQSPRGASGETITCSGRDLI